MTDKIQQARRAAFEAWAPYRTDLNKDGFYASSHTRAQWSAFNAALDCVVIELPAERQKRQNFKYETLSDSAHNNCRELCIDAIESTNLGLRVK